MALASDRRIAAICAALVAIGPVSLALYTPAMPALVAVFGTTAAAVKLTLTAYFAGFALMQLVCGPLSDAYGRRSVAIAFIGIYLLASVVALLSPTIESLIAARALQGAGAAAGVAISRAIVRDLYTGQTAARIMNVIGMMLAIGPALSPTIGGLTLELFGWREIFALMVLYGAGLVAVLVFGFRETNHHRDPRQLDPSRLLRNYAALLGDRRFMRPGLIIGLTTGSLFTLATVLPFVLIDRVGLSPSGFGYAMILQSGAFFLGSTATSQLLKRVEAGRLVPYGLAITGMAGVMLFGLTQWLAPTLLGVMLPIGLMAAGIALIMPAMMTDTVADFPLIAGSASALSGFLQMGTGLLGSALAALLGDPVAALAFVVPAMPLVALLVYVGLKPSRRASPPVALGAETPAE